MTYDANAYGAQGADLLPPGRAWSIELGSTFRALFDALGIELAEAESRLARVLTESDPRAAAELLGEWLEAFGLPGPCEELPASITLQRSMLEGQVTATGGQSIDYLVAFAAALGWPIEVEEHALFRAGIGAAGDPLPPSDWQWVFDVHAPPFVVRHAYAGEFAAGEPIVDFESDSLACMLPEVVPAHTVARVFLDLASAVGFAPWTKLGAAPLAVEVVLVPPIVHVS